MIFFILSSLTRSFEKSTSDRPNLASVTASVGIYQKSSATSGRWLCRSILNLLSLRHVVLDPRKSCSFPVTTFIGPNFDSSALCTCLTTTFSTWDALVSSTKCAIVNFFTFVVALATQKSHGLSLKPFSIRLSVRRLCHNNSALWHHTTLCSARDRKFCDLPF